jgi:hypothetical protein
MATVTSLDAAPGRVRKGGALTMDTTTTSRYDAFTGPELDSARWVPLVTPTPDGGEWVYQEPGAVTTVSGGVARIEVPRFTRSNDSLQSPDNAKHLLMSAQALPVPGSGSVTFSVDMAARKLNGSADDYRDGFATFNVFDMESLLVFDLISTGDRILAIYERMGVPGVVEGEDAFTYVIDAPLAGVQSAPDGFHRCSITLDVDAGEARFTVDDILVYSVPRLPVIPRRLNLGMGLMTLSPLDGGRSTSLRGQGMIGSWRDFTFMRA